MLRILPIAVVLFLTVADFAFSRSFHAKISKVHGNKVTCQIIILGKPAGIYDPKIIEAVNQVLVTRYSGKGKEAEPVKDGLGDPLFKDIDDKGLFVWLTISDAGDNAGKITEISIRPRPPAPSFERLQDG